LQTFQEIKETKFGCSHQPTIEGIVPLDGSTTKSNTVSWSYYICNPFLVVHFHYFGAQKAID